MVIDKPQVKFISAQLIANSDLETESTGYFQLPDKYRDLILALLGDPTPLRGTLSRNVPVCRLIIRYGDGRETALEVVWQGGTNMLFFTHGGCTLSRGKGYYPVRWDEDEFMDEAAALVGLLDEVNKNNDEAAARYEKSLRRSVGLDKAP